MTFSVREQDQKYYEYIRIKFFIGARFLIKKYFTGIKKKTAKPNVPSESKNWSNFILYLIVITNYVPVVTLRLSEM